MHSQNSYFAAFLYNEVVMLSVREVLLQRFHFFQDIFIHFPYRLTTGKTDHKGHGRTPLAFF